MRSAHLAAATVLLFGCASETQENSNSIGDSVMPASESCSSLLGEAVMSAGGAGANTFQGDARSTHNRVASEPLVGGEAIGKAAVELVRGAKHEVLIEFFTIEKNSWLAEELGKAVKSLPTSVDVHVLTNPYPRARFGIFGQNFLEEKRSDARERMRSIFGRGSNVHVSAWDTKGIFGINHTKQIVVDGKRALIADSNLQSYSDPVERGGRGWFQLGLVLEGEVARTMRRDAISAMTKEDKSPFMAEENLLALDGGSAATASQCTQMAVFARNAGVGDNGASNRAYEALFGAANARVNVVTPNLNDEQAFNALKKATARARVRIVLSKGFNDKEESYPFQGGTNQDNVTKLANNAANKCNLEIRWNADPNGTVVVGQGDHASHAKWASADGLAMILGSQNLDTQSWNQSRELIVLIDAISETAKFDAVFDEKWQASAIAFSPPAACGR